MNRCFVILCFIAFSNAFFFDTKSPIIYGLPGENRTDYFGYSVALFGGQQPWIQIGAPKAIARNGLRSGVVYRCGIMQSCSTLNIEDPTNLNGSFIGNSMDVSPLQDIYAVCGHRWTQRKSSDYYAHGACYYGSTNQTSRSTTLLDVLKDYQTDIGNAGSATIYYYGQAQAGFAAQFMNDKNAKSGSLILGAPGTYNWAGGALLVNPSSPTVNPPASRRSRRDLGSTVVPAASSSDEAYFSYFGYSVSSGNYLTTTDTLVAAGIPRSSMIGEVALFNFRNNGINKVANNFQGFQFGEYFGGAVATADVNGDGKDDLIVGAPTYKREKYDEGRVYVYSTDIDKSTGTTKVQIPGQSTGGRFGETIAALGDIDYDGYEDIAVAAPNEDNGRGVVYIYRGSPEGLLTTPIQRIEGKSFGESIRGFGYSMSRAADIDGNHCGDLAIGAYQSGHAFLFRSSPVISLTNTFRPSLEQIPPNINTFTFKSCIDFTKKCEKCQLAATTVDVKITIDPILQRASIDRPNRIITLGSTSKCQDYTVTVTSNHTLEQPLKIFVTASLVGSQTQESGNQQDTPVMISLIDGGVNGKDSFCKNCPVLDSESKVEFDHSVVFFLGCGLDNKCKSQLTMQPSFVNHENNKFILGSEKHLTLKTDVRNEGDKAYSTKLTVNFPSEISLRSVPSSCKENNKTSITCNAGNPLGKGESKSVELNFEMETVNNGNKTTLDFELNIATSSENLNAQKTQTLTLDVIKVADITLTGKSKDQSYYYENTTSVVEFGQVLQVQKEGSSAINDVLVDISIPTALNGETFLELSNEISSKCRKIGANNNNNNDNTLTRRRRSADSAADYLQYPNRTFFVNCSNSDFTCSRYMCNTGRLSVNVYEFQLKFKFNISKIASALQENDIIVFSTQSISSIIDGDITGISTIDNRYSTAITSVLIGQPIDKPIDLWIIIVAVIGGILLLCIIIALLYKFGFFERKTKQMMEEEKLADNEERQENTPLQNGE